MQRLITLVLIVGLSSLGVVVFRSGVFRAANVASSDAEVDRTERFVSIGKPLYAPILPTAPVQAVVGPAKHDSVLIPECRLTVADKQDVPCQRDGVLLFIATDLEPGQIVPPDQIVAVRIANQERQYRRLREGDVVKTGQLLGYLDDQLSRDDWAIKKARLTASQADLNASQRNCEELKTRYDTQQRLRQDGMGVASEEELRSAKLNWEKAAYELMSKREAANLAASDLNQAETVLRMHEIRATLSGTINSIHKKPGEAVKSFEPVFQIQSQARLRVEGMVDVQQLSRLKDGMPVRLESCTSEGPRQKLIGHFQEITQVAINKDIACPLIVSASEDGTVCVWDQATGRVTRTFQHPVPVLSVTCTASNAKGNWCLSGGADGKARLWNLDGNSTEPLRELAGFHTAGITCVAFSPDGQWSATGGEDRAVGVWDTASGKLRYFLPALHGGAITQVQFTPQAQLVSVSRDNTMRLWTLGEQGARLERTWAQRAGEVTALGVSADGQYVLYDETDKIRMLTLPEGKTEGIIQPPPGGTFASFAVFSCDARRILTANGAENLLQLWLAPHSGQRSRELRQLKLPDSLTATTAAMAPNGSFIVVGTRERQLLIWPGRIEEAESVTSGVITLIERAEESSTQQVRIWAEVDNSNGRLLPGMTGKLVVD